MQYPVISTTREVFSTTEIIAWNYSHVLVHAAVKTGAMSAPGSK